MGSGDQGDFARTRFAGMNPIEIDDSVPVDLESRTVVSNHLEFIGTGVGDPEFTVVVKSNPLTSRGYVGQTHADDVRITRHRQQIRIDHTKGTEPAESWVCALC